MVVHCDIVILLLFGLIYLNVGYRYILEEFGSFFPLKTTDIRFCYSMLFAYAVRGCQLYFFEGIKSFFQFYQIQVLGLVVELGDLECAGYFLLLLIDGLHFLATAG